MTALPDSAVPVLLRGVRVHDDRVRGVKVLLAPERALKLDPIGEAILAEVDGARSFGAIVEILASRYAAPVEQIAKDASGFLSGLIDRRMMETRT